MSTAAPDPSDWTPPAVDPTVSLRRQVADVLRARVIAGQLRPGVVYSAPRLARHFGVSATPVREAMLDLVADGLVEVARNKGFRVRRIDDAELDAMAELRELVEVPVMAAVARACDGSLAQAVEGLRELARTIQQAAADGDLVRYLDADTAFHLGFLALHGNQAVVDLVRGLRLKARLYALPSLADAGALHGTAAEHEQLVDLALARDDAGVQDVMRRHIGHVRALWADPPSREPGADGSSTTDASSSAADVGGES